MINNENISLTPVKDKIRIAHWWLDTAKLCIHVWYYHPSVYTRHYDNVAHPTQYINIDLHPDDMNDILNDIQRGDYGHIHDIVVAVIDPDRLGVEWCVPQAN